MSDIRPTPESDEATKKTDWFSGEPMVPADFARNLERQRDEARDELGELKRDLSALLNSLPHGAHDVTEGVVTIRAMREAVKEAHGFITSLEYEGNEKGTRCISCCSHCSESHRRDCALQSTLAKLQPLLKP